MDRRSYLEKVELLVNDKKVLREVYHSDEPERPGVSRLGIMLAWIDPEINPPMKSLSNRTFRRCYRTRSIGSPHCRD
jgi:hypothetical protein